MNPKQRNDEPRPDLEGRGARQRRIGESLAAVELDADEQAWLALGARTIVEHSTQDLHG
jgi:hypothetical protein